MFHTWFSTLICALKNPSHCQRSNLLFVAKCNPGLPRCCTQRNTKVPSLLYLLLKVYSPPGSKSFLQAQQCCCWTGQARILLASANIHPTIEVLSTPRRKELLVLGVLNPLPQGVGGGGRQAESFSGICQIISGAMKS